MRKTSSAALGAGRAAGATARASRRPRPSRRPRALALDRNPAAVYLAALKPGASRSTGRRNLNAIARIAASDPEAEALAFPWERLRYRDTAALRAALAEAHAPATANARLAMLRRVLDECFRLGLMGADDYQRARLVRNVRGRSKPAGRLLEADEVREVMRATSRASGAKAARDACLLAMLYATGARRREILELQYPRDVGRQMLSVSLRTKGSKSLAAHLQPAVRSLLRAWLKHRGRKPGPLFVSVDRFERLGTSTLSPSALVAVCHAWADRAGVAHFSPHDLRRTFATSLFDNGVEGHVVQSMLGHESISTTALYDRAVDRRVEHAAARLPLPF